MVYPNKRRDNREPGIFFRDFSCNWMDRQQLIPVMLEWIGTISVLLNTNCLFACCARAGAVVTMNTAKKSNHF
jgi:hypothetical protein